MEFMQNILKAGNLNETQKILAIAMFMDPKQCPDTKIDPEIIELGYKVKSLVDKSKISLSFSKDSKLNISLH